MVSKRKKSNRQQFEIIRLSEPMSSISIYRGHEPSIPILQRELGIERHTELLTWPSTSSIICTGMRSSRYSIPDQHSWIGVREVTWPGSSVSWKKARSELTTDPWAEEFIWTLFRPPARVFSYLKLLWMPRGRDSCIPYSGPISMSLFG